LHNYLASIFDQKNLDNIQNVEYIKKIQQLFGKKKYLVISIFIIVQFGAILIIDQQNLEKRYMTYMI
jgi:hypothetical protein